MTSQKKVLSAGRPAGHLECSHEEADGRLLLHAVDATLHGADIVDIFPQDTDVLVLTVRRYPQLATETNIINGTSSKSRIVPIKPIYDSLGYARTAALPGFHALSGADLTVHFIGKGKLTSWKVFMKADNDILEAFNGYHRKWK